MTWKIAILGLLLASSLAGCGRHTPSNPGKPSDVTATAYRIFVEPSGSETVDALVRQLVSNRPAPYPSGTPDTPGAVQFGKYLTPEVQTALKKLKSMGPAIFPALVKHIWDDRYSYSDTVAAWGNYTVGDAVVEVLCDGHYMHSGYKWRESPSGGAGYLSFKGYLQERGYDAWTEWAKTKTRLEIQMDFIDWCIDQENARGYTDENQRRRILKNYEQARQGLLSEYSEPGAANESSFSKRCGITIHSRASASTADYRSGAWLVQIPPLFANKPRHRMSGNHTNLKFGHRSMSLVGAVLLGCCERCPLRHSKSWIYAGSFRYSSGAGWRFPGSSLSLAAGTH